MTSARSIFRERGRPCLAVIRPAALRFGVIWTPQYPSAEPLRTVVWFASPLLQQAMGLRVFHWQSRTCHEIGLVHAGLAMEEL